MGREHANLGLLLGDRIAELLKTHDKTLEIAQFKGSLKNCMGAAINKCLTKLCCVGYKTFLSKYSVYDS